MPRKPAPSTRGAPPEAWESKAQTVVKSRDEVVVAMLDGVNLRLAKIEEGIVMLARVEERHEALEKALAVHIEADNEHHRHLAVQTERIANVLDALEGRIDKLESHRDISVDNREAKRYWWVLIGGIVTAVGGIALVAVEYWNGHMETTRQIESMPHSVPAPQIEYVVPEPKLSAGPRPRAAPVMPNPNRDPLPIDHGQ